MIDGAIYCRPDGTYVIQRNGYPYHVVLDDPLIGEVLETITDHPESLVPEPVPPPPSPANLLRAEEAQLLAYLASTDWYAIRLAETGVEIPAEVVEERAEARARISGIRAEL